MLILLKCYFNHITYFFAIQEYEAKVEKQKKEYDEKMKEWKASGGGAKKSTDGGDAEKSPKKTKKSAAPTTPSKGGSGGGFKSKEYISSDESSDDDADAKAKVSFANEGLVFIFFNGNCRILGKNKDIEI